MLSSRPSSSVRLSAVGVALAFGIVAASPRVARADIDPASGIDLVTITHPGNAPWPGGDGPMANNAGRGSVAYEYRIGRYEVTTAQWAEFMTAAYNRPQSDWIPHLAPPTFWGASATSVGAVPGGKRYVYSPQNAMRPVGNISWRMAAIYCNWLTNNKSLDRAAFLSSAYDVSTFGYEGNIFTDQLTRSAGARYFIPTLDEWIKAAHYDPNRYGENQEGWWHYSHTSDTFAIPGAPGTITPGGPAQANYGNYDPFGDVSIYNLGAYAGVTSPWGLYDTAGATKEWNEEVYGLEGGVRSRGNDGSYWFNGGAAADTVWGGSSALPNDSTYGYGFRIAAVVPAPYSGGLTAMGVIWYTWRQRRRPCVTSHRSWR